MHTCNLLQHLFFYSGIYPVFESESVNLFEWHNLNDLNVYCITIDLQINPAVNLLISADTETLFWFLWKAVKVNS